MPEITKGNISKTLDIQIFKYAKHLMDNIKNHRLKDEYDAPIEFEPINQIQPDDQTDGLIKSHTHQILKFIDEAERAINKPQTVRLGITKIKKLIKLYDELNKVAVGDVSSFAEFKSTFEDMRHTIEKPRHNFITLALRIGVAVLFGLVVFAPLMYQLMWKIIWKPEGAKFTKSINDTLQKAEMGIDQRGTTSKILQNPSLESLRRPSIASTVTLSADSSRRSSFASNNPSRRSSFSSLFADESDNPSLDLAVKINTMAEYLRLQIKEFAIYLMPANSKAADSAREKVKELFETDFMAAFDDGINATDQLDNPYAQPNTDKIRILKELYSELNRVNWQLVIKGSPLKDDQDFRNFKNTFEQKREKLNITNPILFRNDYLAQAQAKATATINAAANLSPVKAVTHMGSRIVSSIPLVSTFTHASPNTVNEKYYTDKIDRIIQDILQLQKMNGQPEAPKTDMQQLHA
jgi:hypothetical protein